MNTAKKPPRPTDWPVYWFAALERATQDGDLEAAAQAVRQLRRLGYEVVCRLRPPITEALT